MNMPDDIVAIWGVPRSGTTWLGQIFNSSPKTIFRYQPLFSYTFKNRLSAQSTLGEIDLFFEELISTNDNFILNGLADPSEKKRLNFSKNSITPHMIMKHVRYHHVINNLLDKKKNIKIIGIIRNPCAVINSWIRSPKEFDNRWDPRKEWQFALKKNMNRIEEYYGFEKWKEATLLFHKLKKDYSDRFYLLRYEDLVNTPLEITKDIFSFTGIEFLKQTEDFLRKCHEQHEENQYAVFKDKSVVSKWKNQLDISIKDAIRDILIGQDIESYLH